MLTAILWDYDGTLADTPQKNLRVAREVLRRLDPDLLRPEPPALRSLEAYLEANYRFKNWRELYVRAYGVPEERLDEAGRLWEPCQAADGTCPPLFSGLGEVLGDLRGIPMGICSQNSAGSIRAALAAHGAADCFGAVIGHEDVPFSRQKPHPAAFLACLEALGLEEGRFVYVGDHPEDMTFGKAAQAALRDRGLRAEVLCAGALWGSPREPDWTTPPDRIVRTPAELAAWLREI